VIKRGKEIYMAASFYGVDVDKILGIKQGGRGYGVSIAVARDGKVETYCSGSGRYGEVFPVTPDMLFQAGSVSKPNFALTLLRYYDRGEIDIDADVQEYLRDFFDFPVTLEALLSHTAGLNVHGFRGYPADHEKLSLEDVLAGRGSSPKVKQVKPYGKQYMYSGGGTTAAELVFTKITGKTLRQAYKEEIADTLGLRRTGYFQPLDEKLVANAAFGGRLAAKKGEDPEHAYHYYPEHAAAGLWTTPTELTTIGLAVSRSYREGGLLKKETAKRMVTPVLDNYGLCIQRESDDVAGHGGANEGFHTFWNFSLKKDLCVAVMMNRLSMLTVPRLVKVGREIFEAADR
jgi:CubicO group peptidase (beta-lactamase class C family)